MIDLRHIYSLSDFQRNTRAHIRRLKRSGSPAVLTVNGQAELVVQDAAAYQRALDDRKGSELPSLVGHPDPIIELYKEGVDRTLLRRNLERTVDERLAGLVALQRLAVEARRAGRASEADT